MFEISGVYGIKQIPLTGAITRTKSTFKMHLNTEAGVMRFLDEEKPFESVTIRDPITKKDWTEYFLGK